MSRALRCLALLALLVPAACSTPREAPACSGPTFALNEGRWQPTAEESGR